VLGEGAFGTVRLVRHAVRDGCVSVCPDAPKGSQTRFPQPTDTFYALKVMQKARIVEMSQQRNVLMEKNVMMRANHPYVRVVFV
jgi:serine/threonine protein kinase